jgi:hypothetical protein
MGICAVVEVEEFESAVKSEVEARMYAVEDISRLPSEEIWAVHLELYTVSSFHYR